MSNRRVLAASVLVLALAWPLSAHWTNRYPKLAGFNHHVYVEGYDLPTLAAGPTYPALSPDGGHVAFSARGWLWVMDLDTRVARRLTSGTSMDSRPAWSRDGKRLAFVRDDTRQTTIVEIEVAPAQGTDRTERVLVDVPAIVLDPAYAPDGRALYFASAEAGDLDIWRVDLESGERTPVTSGRGLDVRPQPAAGGTLLFLARRGAGDEVVVVDDTGTRRAIAVAPIASQARPGVSPDGRHTVVGLPDARGWTLHLLDLAGGPSIQIGQGDRKPLMPSWSPDGRFVYFVRTDARQRFRLYRVAATGGAVEEVSPSQWDWGAPTARLTVRTQAGGAGGSSPARLHVVDGSGHAAFPDDRQAWFDGQHGRTFTYSSGELSFELPAGDFRVVAALGFDHAVSTAAGTLAPGQQAIVDIDLIPVGGPSFDEWYSADHHFHLNYGGPFDLTPDDLVPMMRGERLDVATPLVANLHTRTSDERWFGWSRAGRPLIAFGQEVRPHFLGHTGHIGLQTLFWPWYWGPGYPVYGRDDRSNADALRHTRSEGGLTSYVHPVSLRQPFPADAPPRGLPLELVSDVVLGDVDTLEVACLWSDELGTSEAWYRFLNIGSRVALSAGTDVMTDFFRTMAVGATRVYVQVAGELTMGRYLEGLKAGRSFVTTAPLLKFRVADQEPGGVVDAAVDGSVRWQLTVASPVALETVEIVVNGQVVWSGRGLDAAGVQTYEGVLSAPTGGWIAARVHGGPSEWPAMAAYPFAHTGAIWFGSAGSRDETTARRAANELLAALDVAEERLKEGYGEADVPILRSRVAAARAALRAMSGRP